MSWNWAPAPARSPRRCWPPASAPQRLALVERDPELAVFLRRHFPGPRIIEGDAARLPRLLADHGATPVAAVVSSLPLLSLPAEVVNGIVQGVFEALPRGRGAGAIHLRADAAGAARLARAPASRAAHGKRIWRNVPPAVVWTFRRPPAA